MIPYLLPPLPWQARKYLVQFEKFIIHLHLSFFTVISKISNQGKQQYIVGRVPKTLLSNISQKGLQCLLGTGFLLHSLRPLRESYHNK